MKGVYISVHLLRGMLRDYFDDDYNENDVAQLKGILEADKYQWILDNIKYYDREVRK